MTWAPQSRVLIHSRSYGGPEDFHSRTILKIFAFKLVKYLNCRRCFYRFFQGRKPIKSWTGSCATQVQKALQIVQTTYQWEWMTPNTESTDKHSVDLPVGLTKVCLLFAPGSRTVSVLQVGGRSECVDHPGTFTVSDIFWLLPKGGPRSEVRIQIHQSMSSSRHHIVK